MLSNRNKELYNSLYWLRALVRWSPHSSPHCVRPRLCLYWDPPRCPVPAGNSVKREMELNNRMKCSNFDLLHNFEEKKQLILSALSSLRRLSGHLVCKTAAGILQQVLGSIPFSFPNLAWGSFSVLGCQFLREEPQLHNKQTKKQACSEIFAAGAHLLRCSFI